MQKLKYLTVWSKKYKVKRSAKFEIPESLEPLDQTSQALPSRGRDRQCEPSWSEMGRI